MRTSPEGLVPIETTVRSLVGSVLVGPCRRGSIRSQVQRVLKAERRKMKSLSAQRSRRVDCRKVGL